MAENTGVESFLAGFLIGGVIGAGVALLFAPASGKETREFIRIQTDKALEEGKDEWDKLRQLIHEEIIKVADGKDALVDAVHAGVSKFKKQGDKPAAPKAKLEEATS